MICLACRVTQKSHSKCKQMKCLPLNVIFIILKFNLQVQKVSLSNTFYDYLRLARSVLLYFREIVLKSLSDEDKVNDSLKREREKYVMNRSYASLECVFFYFKRCSLVNDSQKIDLSCKLFNWQQSVYAQFSLLFRTKKKLVYSASGVRASFNFVFH